jgi:hypothetical protein
MMCVTIHLTFWIIYVDALYALYVIACSYMIYILIVAQIVINIYAKNVCLEQFHLLRVETTGNITTVIEIYVGQHAKRLIVKIVLMCTKNSGY